MRESSNQETPNIQVINHHKQQELLLKFQYRISCMCPLVVTYYSDTSTKDEKQTGVFKGKQVKQM